MNQNQAQTPSDSEKGSTDNFQHNENGSATHSTLNRIATYDHVPLYDPDTGKVNLIPMPTSDPNDPLNLPKWRKLLTIAALCLFGAFAAAAEVILGAMLPVFAFLYANLDPKSLQYIHLPTGTNGIEGLKLLLQYGDGPPIWRVYLLASLPVLMIGIVNVLFVPLAISVGRKPVMLASGCVAIAGAVWAGHTGHSLESHLAARCFQAVGAGTVESLLPFIIQDMVFYHQRNAAISAVFVCQGLIIVGFGIASPYIIINLDWTWIYFITAIAAGVFWFAVLFTMPETRFHRSQAEMKGMPVETLPEGHDRPNIDYEKYSTKSYIQSLSPFQGKMDFRSGFVAVWHVAQTFFYPHILFVSLLNGIMITAALGAGYTVAPALLTMPYNWPFLHLGLLLIVVIISSVGTFIISGLGADWFANYMAKKTGVRNPEVQALNLILPVVFGIVGCILFGLAGDNETKYPWPVYLLGLGLITFGFLSTSSIGIVYVLESYPHLAGPSLVNIASVRCIIAFVLTFRISEWVADMGYLDTFAIYAGVMGFFLLFIPVLYFFGPAMRKRWPGPRTLVKHDTALHEYEA